MFYSLNLHFFFKFYDLNKTKPKKNNIGQQYFYGYCDVYTFFFHIHIYSRLDAIINDNRFRRCFVPTKALCDLSRYYI